MNNVVDEEKKAHLEVAKKFIIFDNDTDNNKFKVGEYLQLLTKKIPSLKINYAQEYIWTVEAAEITKLKNVYACVESIINYN